jgi:glycosyltransferase involved in cell wall biosynthesis
MKILIFPASFPPVGGGLSEVTVRLAKEFKRAGQHVVVITQRYPRKLEKKEILENIEVYRILFPNVFPFPFKWNILFKYIIGLLLAPFSLLKLFHLVKQEKPEAVYMHFVGTGAIYLLICRLVLSFKLFVTFHGHDVEGIPFISRLHKWVFVKTCSVANFVTACSNDLLKKAITICPEISKKSTVIHNGIDFEEFKGIEEYRHTRPYIFAAGRFFHKKGFDVLIKAFSILLQEGLCIDLILAGAGPELNKHKNLADNLKIPWKDNNETLNTSCPSLIFWGWATRQEMRSLLSGSEVVVVPSREESFGLVVLEAFAAETPAIAGNVGGISEIIDDKQAILVESEDEYAIANGVRIILKRQDLKTLLVRRGKERAMEFSWDKIADTYLSLVKQNK